MTDQRSQTAEIYPADQRGSRGHGFTLVEALIVITLIGTVVGFGVESLRGHRARQAARSGATELMSVLDAARSRAASTRRAAVVDFTPGGRATSRGFYQVYLDIDGDLTIDPGEVEAALPADVEAPIDEHGHRLPATMYFHAPEGASVGPLGIDVVRDGVTFADDILSFGPDGTVSEPGHVTMLDEDGRAYAVTLAEDGEVRLYRWDGRTWR